MEQEEYTHVPNRAPRRKGDNLSIPLAIVFAGILIGGAIIFSDRPAPAQANNAAGIPARAQGGADTDQAPVELLTLRSNDHVLGNPDADVVLIEYSDAQCPFCQRFHSTLQQVMENYGKTGAVAIVYRHFPLSQIHPYAQKGAEGLECANELGGNVAFWKFEDKIFATDTASIEESALPSLASAIGLDPQKFASCVSSGKYAGRVQKDYEDGVNIGVKGTPYTVIWNRKTGKQMSLNGAYPYENVKTILGIVSTE